MQKIVLCVVFLLCHVAGVQAADKAVEKSHAEPSVSIHCSLSGGMRKVEFQNRTLTYTQTVRKKTDTKAVHASLQSFAEVRKRTKISSDQRKKLQKWAETLASKDIKKVEQPDEQDMGAARYADSLNVAIDGKSYGYNHHTIKNSKKLDEAIDNLLKLAQEFTEY